MSGYRDLIDRRCKRSIAMILGVKEREADRYLPPEAQARLRKVVIDTLNDFSTMAVDILECADGDVVINDLWLERLEAIYAAVAS